MVLLVRFKSRLPEEEIANVVEARIGKFQALVGLRQKYYMFDTATGEFAGLYLWDSEEELAAYQESDLKKSIAEAYQADGEVRVETYEVVRAIFE